MTGSRNMIKNRFILAEFSLMILIIPALAGQLAPLTREPADGMGTLEISDIRHNAIFSQKIAIDRITDTKPFISGQLIQKDIFDSYKKVQGTIVNFPPDGVYSGRFTPGNYGVTLLDGNGGHSEYAIVTIDQGYLSSITFVGHASSGFVVRNSSVLLPNSTPDPVWTCSTTKVWHPAHFEKFWRPFCGVWGWDWELWPGYWENVTTCEWSS